MIIKTTPNDQSTTRRFLYEEVAKRSAEWGAQYGGRVGLVVGATDTEALVRVRALVPETWILAPGACFYVSRVYWLYKSAPIDIKNPSTPRQTPH